MSFTNRLRAFASVGADGTATLRIVPPQAVMRARSGSVLQRVVASVPLPPVANVLNDSFTTAVASGWGVPDIGPAFAVLTGVDASVSGGEGRIAAAGATLNALSSPLGLTDLDLFTVLNAPGAGAATVFTGFRLLLRVLDASNYYFLGVATDAAQNVTSIALMRRLAGVETVLATSAAVVLATPTNLRFRAIGPLLSGTVWVVGTLEPAAMVQASDLSLTLPGGAGGGRGGVGNLVRIDNMIGTALSAQAPIWDAYLGPVLPQNLVDSSITAASRWVPTLATGQTAYRGEELNVVARVAPIGQQVELQATFVTED